MNNSFFKIIVAVFIVLACLALFPRFLGNSGTVDDDPADKLNIELSAVDKGSVETITIGAKGDEKILSRKDGVWRIGDDEADQVKMDALFEDFLSLKVKEIASRNESNYEKFKVTEEAGIVLKVVSGGKDISYIVGKGGSVAGELYIRKNGMKNVYLVDGGDLSEALNRSAQDWKKKEPKDAEKPEVKQE